MTKKLKDTVITKKERQADSESDKPSPELLYLIAVVNEICKPYRADFQKLPSSTMIKERIYSKLDVLYEICKKKKIQLHTG